MAPPARARALPGPDARVRSRTDAGKVTAEKRRLRETTRGTVRAPSASTGGSQPGEAGATARTPERTTRAAPGGRRIPRDTGPLTRMAPARMPHLISEIGSLA
ncbi:hypothetical protein GCM10010417_07470 [Streptomyces carpaticus]